MGFEMNELETLEKKARRLELLSRLSQELYSEKDLQRLLERIWRELTEVLEARRSSLFLVDQQRDELYSVIAQQEQEIRFPRTAGISGAVAASGRSLLIADAYQDPRFNPEVDRKTGFRTRSILTVPLKDSTGAVLGVCQVLNRRDGKPFDGADQRLLEALAAIAGSAIETLQLVAEQQQATEATITALVTALEMRVPREKGHSLAVRAYSRALARQMRLDESEVNLIERAAALHDIGKLAVPDEVLNKETPLDETQLRAYEAHALRTAQFLEAMEFTGELQSIETIAPFHHRKYGGGGYPKDGPSGEDLPLGARIIAVADALWVLETPRWGTQALQRRQSIEHLKQRAGADYDPKVVQALLQIAPQLGDLLQGATCRLAAQHGGAR